MGERFCFFIYLFCLFVVIHSAHTIINSYFDIVHCNDGHHFLSHLFLPSLVAPIFQILCFDVHLYIPVRPSVEGSFLKTIHVGYMSTPTTFFLSRSSQCSTTGVTKAVAANWKE